MSKSHSKCLIEKSVSAAVSAIEVYNKPDFKYREETFAVLMMNAWELVLKARIVQQNSNKVSSIYVYEYKQNKQGQKSKKPTVRYNRSKNAMTIGTLKAIEILIALGNKELDGACKENIFVLREIRDNAVHFKNNDSFLSSKVQEVGTASLRNYLNLIRIWFNYDLSKYNFFLMPLSFFHEFDVAKSLSVEKQSDQIKNLLNFIKQQEQIHPSNEDSEFNISLKLETQFVKANAVDAMKVQYSNDPDALRINITEEDAMKKFPLSHTALTDILKNKYSDFKMDKKYHALKDQLKANEKFARVRLLNPNNPNSSKQTFYCSEIVKEFDKHYTKRKTS